MLFENHTMSLITDAGMMMNDINNIDFVTVAAVTMSDAFLQHPNVFNAGILMPPTEILMRWADGDKLIMQNEYPRYLDMNQAADDFIVALLAALVKKNVILYIPRDEFGIFGQYLLNHIYFRYGIIMNTPTTKFSFDKSRLPLIISKFYMSDLMTADDYLASYPGNLKLPDFVINKLAVELRPFATQMTFMEYSNYFNQINASKLNSVEQKVMVRMVNKDDNIHR